MSEINEIKTGKPLLIWVIAVLLLVSGIVWLFNRSERIISTGIIRYEEFQEIYNTCEKLNTDLSIITDPYPY